MRQATTRIEVAPGTTPIAAPTRGGLRYYLRGSWLFFKRMWPAIYDLSTPEAYVYASAIAFNLILSFLPFMILLGSVLLNVFNWQRGYETVYVLVRAFFPVDSKTLFWGLDEVTRGPSGRAGLISFGLLVFASTGVFAPLELALNRAWGFQRPRGFLRQYVIYILLVAVCGAVILAGVSLASLWDYALAAVIGDTMRATVFKAISVLVSLPFIALIFFLIYYWVPNGKVQANQIFFTSAATALLWVLMTFGYWLVLPLLDFQSSYGRLFTLVALITWVFMTAFIMILGANLSAREVLPRAWTGRLPQPR
jgi:membrane protein/epoxyqueuosine reductase